MTKPAVLLAAFMLSGCAGWKADQRISSLESQAQGQRVLDMRLSRVEDRIVAMEEEIGARNGGAARPVAAGKGAANAGATPARSADAKKSAAMTEQAAELRKPATPTPAPVYEPRPVAKPIATAVVTGQPAPRQPYAGTVQPRAVQPASGNAVADALTSLEENQNKNAGVTPSASAGRRVEPAPVAVKADAVEPQGLARYKTGQAGYDAALATYEKGKYKEAITQLQEFAAANPKSSLVANAIYWQGEARYSLGQYAEAVLLFKEVAATYPKHTKTPDALLKAGLSYSKLKDPENARFHWQILVEDFPGTHAATLAKKYMGPGK